MTEERLKVRFVNPNNTRNIGFQADSCANDVYLLTCSAFGV